MSFNTFQFCFMVVCLKMLSPRKVKNLALPTWRLPKDYKDSSGSRWTSELAPVSLPLIKSIYCSNYCYFPYVWGWGRCMCFCVCAYARVHAFKCTCAHVCVQVCMHTCVKARSQFRTSSSVTLCLRYIYFQSFSFMCMVILPTCMSVYHVHVWCLQRPKESVGSCGTGVPDDCKLPCQW